MNLATFVVGALVVLLLAHAAYRVYRMARNNDLCYACPHAGKCGGGRSKINCTIRQDEQK